MIFKIVPSDKFPEIKQPGTISVGSYTLIPKKPDTIQSLNNDKRQDFSGDIDIDNNDKKEYGNILPPELNEITDYSEEEKAENVLTSPSSKPTMI